MRQLVPDVGAGQGTSQCQGVGDRPTGRILTELASVGLGPTDPTSDRNPKPPPSGGGVFTAMS